MPDRHAAHLCRDPFDDALDAVVSGDASPRDWTILNDTLRSDPAARRTYIRSIAFEAMLAREFPPIEESSPTPANRRHRWFVPAAIAATITLAAILAPRPNPASPRAATDVLTQNESEFTHAVVTMLDGAAGRFGILPLTAGQRLPAGTLELDHGLAGITFDCGAEVTIEGPARLQLESQHMVRLAVGRAAARIPDQARGFVFLTPSSFIRDLGTTYALEVLDDRVTDLHVLEGEVEVAATGRHPLPVPKILRQREAVRCAAGDLLPIHFRPDNPATRRKHQAPKVPPSVHWSFDAWSAGTTVDPNRNHALEWRHGRLPATPTIIDGPFGSALRFNGNGAFARTDYPGVDGSQARTVACWLRLDPSANRAVTGLIAWGANRPSAKWQIGWNTAHAQGTPGAPRVDFGDGHVIGTTDLRDGRWHHLAVVFLGGQQANVASHVRIYLDGRLEPLTGRRRQQIDTDTTSVDARPLTLGRPPGRGSGSFEGDLDEVHVFEGALLPGQIERLMTSNRLRGKTAGLAGQ